MLRKYLPAQAKVLEVGSGTGQHAVYFAAAMPGWVWQCSDQPAQLAGIRQWLDEASLPNTPPVIELQVAGQAWPSIPVDAVYTANTLHIMAWEEVEAFFVAVGSVLRPGGRLVVYGPFNYQGRYTSESNAQFDVWLKSQAPHRAIRDFEAVDRLAVSQGLQLLDDMEMPANNRCLVWQCRSVQ